MKDIAKWADLENAKNDFPEIGFSKVMKLQKIYRVRLNGRNFIKFEKSL